MRDGVQGLNDTTLIYMQGGAGIYLYQNGKRLLLLGTNNRYAFQENHRYENAMAERVNGILKDEFYLDQTFSNVAYAKRAAKNAIKLYNEIRLHLSLDYKTPNMVYKLTT